MGMFLIEYSYGKLSAMDIMGWKSLKWVLWGNRLYRNRMNFIMDTRDNRRYQLQMKSDLGNTVVTVNSDYRGKVHLLAYYLQTQKYYGKVIDLEDGSVIWASNT